MASSPLELRFARLADARKPAQPAAFPVIAKPLSKEDESKHAFKMRYFATYEDLRDAFLLDPGFGVQNLLQEFCPGDGVGIEILFRENQPLTMFQHRRIKEFPVSGGGSVTSSFRAARPAACRTGSGPVARTQVGRRGDGGV